MKARRSRPNTLSVWMNGEHVGDWTGGTSTSSEFTYAGSWWDSMNARALSISLQRLPGDAPHRGAYVTAWFDNLLPDSPTIRERLKRRFKTPSTEAMDLLAAIGRDCVGAVQLMPEGETPLATREINAIPLSDADVAQMLRAVTSGAPFGMGKSEETPFRISIAGAQEKTALLRHDGRWCEPLATTPTTHILKLPLGLIGNVRADMTHSVENEWLCLKLLSSWGLPTAKAELARFSDHISEESVLVVERFDRRLQIEQAPAESWFIRLPQEDLCQAFGVPRDKKYEADDGPGIRKIIELLAWGATPNTDITLFVLAQLAGWLLAAPDGHAKNYSVFLKREGHTLTPLYDVLSAWPIIGPGANELPEQKVELAMGLRRRQSLERKIRRIATVHWKALADQSTVPGMFQLMEQFIERADQSFDQVANSLPPDFPPVVWERIQNGVRAQCEKFRLGAAALEGA